MLKSILKLIGLVKSQLQQYIKSVNGLIMKKPIKTTLDEEVEDFANRILSNVTLLEKCNKDWLIAFREVRKN